MGGDEDIELYKLKGYNKSMQKTYLELMQVDELVGRLYAKDAKLRDGKFGYAWKRFVDKNIAPVMSELNDRLMDNKVENALTDPTTKELLYTADKNFKYSKEGMKVLLDANRKLLKEFEGRQIEIKPFYVADLPELLEEEKELLKGLIIAE